MNSKVEHSTDRPVELLEKNIPRQERAIKTYEGILKATAELLIEVGLERISTNLIAERAGVTVPALYRYFPNKYSVLNTLGARLMDQQNEVVTNWHQTYVAGQSIDYMLDNLYALLYEGYLAVRNFTGGLEILYGMQTLGPLRATRLQNQRDMAEAFGLMWCEEYGVTYTEDIGRKARVAVQLGQMPAQLLLEDESLDPEAIMREGALALRLYLQSTMQPLIK
jgi:AcrR family transcriptional regulator